jgi:DNA-binding transcriptional MerR regulator/methylmalonyl-CoA mutase cobalamin-binding subunit
MTKSNTAQSEESPASSPSLPIRTVSALTGVSSFTLRAWERRYGLVVPQRTENGQRVYTARDVDRIKKVLALLDSGVALPQVNGLLDAIAEQEVPTPTRDFWTRLRDRMADRISDFDESGLDEAYQEALALHPIETVTGNLLLPLLNAVGARWLSTEIGIAEEHFFAIYLRNKLGARFHHRRIPHNGPLLLCACLPGERHDLGQLLFALAAHDRGYRTVLLGADVPLTAVEAAAGKTSADAVVLSATIEPPASFWTDDLKSLVDAVSMPVLVGGATSLTHRRQIAECGAHDLGCDLRLSFQRLGEVFERAG